MPIIEITTLTHPGVEIFSTLTEAQLRREYIAEWRNGVMQVLDNTYVVDKNGIKHKLQKKQPKS